MTAVTREQTGQVRGFEDLLAWRACRELRLFVSTMARDLPTGERYRLADQMIRSSRAASALIAEGYGRYHFKENVQCCRQSRGELYELVDHLIVANDEGYIDDTRYAEGRQLATRAIELVNGYIRFLISQQTSEGKQTVGANTRRKNATRDGAGL